MTRQHQHPLRTLDRVACEERNGRPNGKAPNTRASRGVPGPVIRADPEAPIALGDMALFHDQLFSHGQHVGDTAGSCVVVGLAPDFPNNCSGVFSLPGGIITTQFVTAPGPGAKPIALTGGTGIYRNIGGDGTFVEFGNGTGRLTLHVLSLGPGGGGS